MLPQKVSTYLNHLKVFISFSYKAIEFTAAGIMEIVQVNTDNLLMKMKFGFEGSGSHPMYKQINKVNTNNIILTMFCPLEIIDCGNVRIWPSPKCTPFTTGNFITDGERKC